MKNTSIVFAVLSVFLFLAGCGTGEYESRLQKAASSSSSGSKFTSDLAEEITVPGTSISLRLPKPMQSVDTSDAVRGKIPLFEVTGLKATYEGSLEDPETKAKQCFYLYVVSGELPPGGRTSMQSWLSDYTNKFPNSADSSAAVNTNYSVPTPEGTSLPCEEFHYSKCMMKFFYPNPAKPQNSQDMPGNVVYLCHVENNQFVALIFRYPSNLSDYHSAAFDPDWIKLIAGTLKMGASGG
jgi:hypothetical protein